MKYLLSFVPVALAAVYLLLRALGVLQVPEASGYSDALVVASGLLGFSYLSARLFADEKLEQMEDAARQMRDAIGDADALRKVVQRFMLLQQTAGEELGKLQEVTMAAAARIETIDSSRVRELSTVASHAVESAERADEASKAMMERLLDAHSAVWRNAAGNDDLVSQITRELDIYLQRAGLTALVETGILLDGVQHEVEEAVLVDEEQDGLVVRVIRPGYQRDGRVVRRALVHVGSATTTSPQSEAARSVEEATHSTSEVHEENEQ